MFFTNPPKIAKPSSSQNLIINHESFVYLSFSIYLPSKTNKVIYANVPLLFSLRHAVRFRFNQMLYAWQWIPKTTYKVRRLELRGRKKNDKHIRIPNHFEVMPVGHYPNDMEDCFNVSSSILLTTHGYNLVREKQREDNDDHNDDDDEQRRHQNHQAMKLFVWKRALRQGGVSRITRWYTVVWWGSGCGRRQKKKARGGGVLVRATLCEKRKSTSNEDIFEWNMFGRRRRRWRRGRRTRLE